MAKVKRMLSHLIIGIKLTKHSRPARRERSGSSLGRENGTNGRGFWKGSSEAAFKIRSAKAKKNTDTRGVRLPPGEFLRNSRGEMGAGIHTFGSGGETLQGWKGDGEGTSLSNLQGHTTSPAGQEERHRKITSERRIQGGVGGTERPQITENGSACWILS